MSDLGQVGQVRTLIPEPRTHSPHTHRGGLQWPQARLAVKAPYSLTHDLHSPRARVHMVTWSSWDSADWKVLQHCQAAAAGHEGEHGDQGRRGCSTAGLQ